MVFNPIYNWLITGRVNPTLVPKICPHFNHFQQLGVVFFPYKWSYNITGFPVPTLQVFLDIDIDGELAAFQLGQAFVEAEGKKKLFLRSETLACI